MRNLMRRRRRYVSPRPFTPPRPRVLLITAQKFIWLFTLIAFFGFAVWAYTSGFFTIKYIYCTLEEEEEPCPAAVVAELNHHQHQNMLTFRADEVENKILSGSTNIETVVISVSLPSTIQVKLSLRTSTLTAATAIASSQVVSIDSRNVPFQVDQNSKDKSLIIPRVVQRFNP